MEQREIDLQKFSMALTLCGLPVNLATADLIDLVYRKVLDQGGNLSLNDALQIIGTIEKKYPQTQK